MHTGTFLVGFFIYLGAMLLLSWWVSRSQRSGEDFLLGGRCFMFVITLGTTVATMVGTGSSMGAVGFGYANGWAGALYGLGGAIGILLLAWWFAPARELRFMTMSEELSYYVGANRTVKNLTALLMFVASIGWLGAHMLGGGLYLAWIAGIDPALAKTIIAVGFALYVIVGGYTAVVWTDTIQALILFFGFLLMAALALNRIGGYDNLYASMDPAAVSWFAIEKIGVWPALSLAAAVCVGVLGTPSYRQRIYSGASVGTVRRSFVWSGGIYLLFACVPAVIGMAAHALNPNLDNANFAFPYLAVEVLPLAAGLIVLLAGLSATLSSASSDALAGVSILLRDVYSMATGKMPPAGKVVLFSRLGLVAVIGVALIFALLSNDVIGYITKMISMVMSGLFVCGVLGRFWPRFTWQGAVAALVGAFGASLAVLLNDEWLAALGNPALPAVGASLASGVLGSLASPPSRTTRAEALAILTAEREQIEGKAPAA